jgi:cytochrome c oxidase cbb3-type subunit 3
MRMNARMLPAGLLLSALALLPGCRRDARPPVSTTPPQHSERLGARATSSSAPGVRPGIDASVVVGGMANPYTGRTDAIATGRALFTAMNCSGCHSGYGGGGMGPNLRDSVWLYGSTDADLYSTIAEGRPNGMPAWGSRLPRDQIWQIIAYLRTLGTDAEPVRPPTPTRTTASARPPKRAG